MKKVLECATLCFIVFCNLLYANTYWGQTQSSYSNNYYGQAMQGGDEKYHQRQGHANYNTAYSFYKNGDFERALLLFAQLCEQNNYIACLSAGIVQGKMLDTLDSNKKFSRSERQRKKLEYYSTMMAFYTKACNGGIYDACNNLAFYEHTTKKQKEKEKKKKEQDKIEQSRSMELYTKSCRAGNKEACQNIGIIYSGELNENDGQNANLVQAQNYYGRSCSMGDNVACFNLGVLRYNYAKTAGDYAQAIHFLNQACGGDYPAACLNLGIIYERGVTQNSNEDLAHAMQYYTKACYLQNTNACTYLSKLADKRSKIKSQ